MAAVALSLYVGGVSTELQTFTMLSGSRLGASFVVLLVGFLYAVRNRGRNRSESIGMGVLALSLTAVVYLPGMVLGFGILRSGILDPIRLSNRDLESDPAAQRASDKRCSLEPELVEELDEIACV